MTLKLLRKDTEVTAMTPIEAELASLRQERDRLRSRNRRLEAQLATARGWRCQLNLMLEALPVGIIGIDGGGLVAVCNGTAANLLGLQAGDMLQRPLAEALRHHPLTRSLQQLVARSSGRGETLLGWTCGQERRDLRAWAEQMRGSSGNLIGATLVLADARTEREEQERRQAALLSLGHELRSPLTSMLGFAELLSENSLESSQQEQFLGFILQKGQLLRRIVDDLQTMAHCETGEDLQLRRQNEDLVPLLEELRDQFHWQYPEHCFDLSLSDDSLVADCDRQRLQQVLNNLLQNAAQYSAPGSPIHIRAWRWDEEIRISVSDKGPGMSSQECAQALERPFRGAAGATRPDGLGLGLTICRSIVCAHGGTIDIHSRPGLGTEVSFSLPAGNACALALRATEEQPGRCLGPMTAH